MIAYDIEKLKHWYKVMFNLDDHNQVISLPFNMQISVAAALILTLLGVCLSQFARPGRSKYAFRIWAIIRCPDNLNFFLLESLRDL